MSKSKLQIEAQIGRRCLVAGEKPVWEVMVRDQRSGKSIFAYCRSKKDIDEAREEMEDLLTAMVKHKAVPLVWSRIGGHRFDFYAVGEEVQDWLCRELPAEYAPYSIIIKGQIRQHPLTRFRALCEQGKCQFFLRSNKLTPDLATARKPFEVEGRDRLDVQLGYAGLILMQHGASHPTASAITFVDKVCHWPDKSMHRHAEYTPLYNAMKRMIRKRLVYWGARKTQGGAIQRWSRPMLTEGVAAAIRAGKLKIGLKIDKR